MGPENFHVGSFGVLGVGAGAGGKGWVVKAGRMLAAGHPRDQQDVMASVAHYRLMKNSLEEGIKSMSSLVLMSSRSDGHRMILRVRCESAIVKMGSSSLTFIFS